MTTRRPNPSQKMPSEVPSSLRIFSRARRCPPARTRVPWAPWPRAAEHPPARALRLAHPPSPTTGPRRQHIHNMSATSVSAPQRSTQHVSPVCLASPRSWPPLPSPALPLIRTLPLSSLGQLGRAVAVEGTQQRADERAGQRQDVVGCRHRELGAGAPPATV